MAPTSVPGRGDASACSSRRTSKQPRCLCRSPRTRAAAVRGERPSRGPGCGSSLGRVTSTPSSTLRRSGVEGVGALHPGAQATSADATASAPAAPAAPPIASAAAPLRPGSDTHAASGCAITSSIAIRASPMSRRRCVGIAFEAARQQLSHAGGVAAGSASQEVGSCARRPPARPRPSRRRTAAAGQHLVQHDAERPDVRAPVDGLAARLLRAHVGRGAEDHARSVPVPRHRRRLRRRRRPDDAGSPSSAFARPKSRTFTVPSGVSLTLAGLRSRCTTPRAPGRPRAPRDLSGDLERLVHRQGAARQPLRQVLALDELEREREVRPPPRARGWRRCSGG